MSLPPHRLRSPLLLCPAERRVRLTHRSSPQPAESGPIIGTYSAGTLPAGLNLADNGTLDGTPNAPGSSSFTLQVTDSSAGTPAKTSKAFSIAVIQLTQVSITSNALASAP